MSRRQKIPSYRLHSQSGQAVVTLPDSLGSRHDVTLGKYDTPESRAEYARVIAEWEASNHHVLPRNGQGSITINELILQLWPTIEAHYRRPDGSPSREQEDFILSLRPMKHLHGHTLATDFGPRALKAVRDLMIHGYEHPDYGTQRPLARSVINQRIGRICRLFKMAVSEELLPETVHRSLNSVPGLRQGRSEARETEPVKPVDDATVNDTLPFLRPQVAALVQLQRHSGIRPGEAVVIRGIDLDTSGPVWNYRPGSDHGPHGQHKNAWRGHDKTIAFGPKAQEIIKPWLRQNVAEYLFQPRESMNAFRAEQRGNRKSKVQPSQAHRSKARPRKRPGERYTSRSYAQAIAKAVKKANTARACEPCKLRRPEERCHTCKANAIPHWHPHQLRHTKATQIRKQFGLDAARAVLGHRSPKVTEVYAEIDVNKAAEVMTMLG